MSRSRLICDQRGYVLLPVLSLMALLAIFVYMANRSISVDQQIYQINTDRDRAFYRARAGLQHTLWGIREQNACFAYQDIPITTFAGGSYNATIASSFGSPVVVKATGVLANGISKTVKSTATVTKTVTIELQPDGANGKDTYLSAAVKDNTTNFGAAVNLTLDNGKNSLNSLIEFNLSNVPAGSQIVSASLKLFLENPGAGSNATDVEVFRINSTQPWNEGVGTGKKGSPANIDGATWVSYDAVNPWLMPGGDFDPSLIASQLVDGKLKNLWYTWDITPLVQDWLNGTLPNYGMYLKPTVAGKLNTALFSSSDSLTCSQRPKLTITLACDCAMGSFSSAGFGAVNLWGMVYLPENTTYNGVVAPAGGAWIFIDNRSPLANWLYITDVTGLLLANLPAPGAGLIPPVNDLHDLTRVTSGTWANHLAFTDSQKAQVDFVDMAGVIQGTFSTSAFSTAPMGIAFIENAIDCTFDTRLGITSAVNQLGVGQGTLFIVDQAGLLISTINIDAFAPNPWGIVHLSGTDNFLVVDFSGQATIIDFLGNIINSYATNTFGVSPQVQGLGLSTTTCHPTVNDAGQQLIMDLP